MMGRRPKGAPKDAPLGNIELTEKQFHLLAWVYLEGYRDVRDSRMRWSPTTYQGRKPTNAEAATLTNRAKTLVKRGLLKRDSRDVVLTDQGRDALEQYLYKHPDVGLEAVKARLELDSDIQLLGELYKVRNGFQRYRRAMGLSKDEAETTLRHFDVLQKAVIDQARLKMEIITEEIGGQTN